MVALYRPGVTRGYSCLTPPVSLGTSHVSRLMSHFSLSELVNLRKFLHIIELYLMSNINQISTYFENEIDRFQV